MGRLNHHYRIDQKKIQILELRVEFLKETFTQKRNKKEKVALRGWEKKKRGKIPWKNSGRD